MIEIQKVGFTYTVEIVDVKGRLRDTETFCNMVPLEGLNYFLSTSLKGGSQLSTWHLGVYTGNYTPVSGDTAATMPASSTEFTAYAGNTRNLVSFGAVSNGAASDMANPSEITVTTPAVLKGAFLISSAAKGAASGVLLSAAKFLTPKSLDTGESLRVTCAISLISN